MLDELDEPPRRLGLNRAQALAGALPANKARAWKSPAGKSLPAVARIFRPVARRPPHR
jgi:hypothetical protein